MPQATNLPPIDELVQVQTVTFDFGAGAYLPNGVTLQGTPTVMISVKSGTDGTPNDRVLQAPRIGTAPAPNGSGRTDCAVLVQIGQCPGPVTYLVQCVCARSDGDIASMDVILPVREP
jgi:hypothetical protein